MIPDDALTVKILSLNTDDILQVYVGRNKTCCCGCAGKHTYNPDFRALGSENRGYEVDEDECDINTIKRVLNKIKKNVTTADWQGDYVAVVIGERPADVWYDRGRGGRPRRVEHKGRLYIAYFKPTEKEMQEKRARKAAYKEETERRNKATLEGAGI